MATGFGGKSETSHLRSTMSRLGLSEPLESWARIRARFRLDVCVDVLASVGLLGLRLELILRLGAEHAVCQCVTNLHGELL